MMRFLLIKLFFIVILLTSKSFASVVEGSGANYYLHDAYNDVGDLRIKTFTYSPNTIYRIVLHVGFQSDIEFSYGETIRLLSAGDTSLIKMEPSDRRLFLKPLQESVHTNIIVITNKRSYYFEVLSVESGDVVDEDFFYVIRFFYPDERITEQ